MLLCRLSWRISGFTSHTNGPRIRCYAKSSECSIPASKEKYVPISGTYPLGFKAGSAHAGVKASNTQFDDLALIASDRSCTAAAVFTTNLFKAAPVVVSKKILTERENQGIRAIIINSGCANAVTGHNGIEDATAMAEETDRCLGEESNHEAGSKSSKTQSLVMSTGVIGQRLPIEKITSKIHTAYNATGTSHEHWLSAAKAICTTDTFPKLLSRIFTLPSSQKEYRIAGMTKGAGMIHPNMATLLGVLCTDLSIASEPLKKALKIATSKSFNNISVDGDTSTNDTVAILANGAVGGPCIEEIGSADYMAFVHTLIDFATDLAKLIVRDGEGATKFVTINVNEAPSSMVARHVASTIARSPLVKTALYGKDANWGRILCAIGYTRRARGVQLAEVNVSFVPSDGSEEVKVLVNGEPEAVDEQRAKEVLEMEDIEIKISLSKDGKGSATFWTCDLSHEYVSINGDYRT